MQVSYLCWRDDEGRSVQLPVKSRSSNFLLALRPQRPARCWAFFNRAENSPPLSPPLSQSVSVSHSMLCSQAFRFPRQSLERTKERTKSVCCSVPLPPMSASSALLSISASSLHPFLPANVFLAPNKTKPISESVMSGLWEERRMSGIIRQTSRHMGWDHMCSTA